MPIYTGGALLHCGSGELRLRAEFFRSVFHSTSPQYLTLASIDFAIAMLAKDGERVYADLYKRVEKLKTAIKSFGYSVFGEKNLENADISLEKNLEKDGIERDFSRLVIDCFPRSGEELQAALEKKNIFAETSFRSLVVFILSPYNLSAIDRLETALREISLEKKEKKPEISYKKSLKECENSLERSAKKPENSPEKSAKRLEIFSEKKDKEDFSYFQGITFVELSDSLFKISATEIGVYPPGIPTVFKGDAVTREILEYLLQNKDNLFGLTEGKIAVFA
jgi:lysine decarboxylase